MPSRVTSRAKQWFFRIACLVLTLTALEGSAWLAYWFIDGQPIDAATVQAQQNGQRFRSAGIPDATLAQERFGATSLHPYLGYVPLPIPALEKYAPAVFGIENDPPLRRPDRVVVGIFGGSVAQAFRELGTKTLKRWISADPRYAGKSFLFVTAAAGGYKQPQSLLALQYLLAVGVEFDLVITIDGFNEVALPVVDNLPRGVHPAYPRSWDLLVGRLFDPVVMGQAAAIESLETRRIEWARRFRRLPRWPITPHLVWKVGDRRFDGAIHEARERVRLATLSKQDPALKGPCHAFASIDQTLDESVEIWRRASIQMAAACRAHGARYVQFLQPNQYLSGSKPMGEAERRVAINASSPYRPNVKQGYPKLRNAGRRLMEAGVPFVDLCDLFAECSEPLYEDDCCHFNEAGYEKLAGAVASAILATPAEIGQRTQSAVK